MYRLMRRSNSLGPILALIIVCLAIVSGPAAAGDPDQEGEKRYRGSGYDFFATDPKGTDFEFQGNLALPAGFFDKGSDRFQGKVPLKGTPIGRFKDHPVGNADAIVERKSMPKLGPPYPSRGTTEIELVALSLESSRPIEVKAGGKTQLWDVKVQLSPKRASVGKATIVQRSDAGGTFSSELPVFASFTFVRQGDGAKRVLDTGSQRLGRGGEEALTLRAQSVPWQKKPPKGALVVRGLSDNFFPGVSDDKINAIREAAPRIRHVIIIVIEL